jgi:hypothetical protein
MASSCFWSVFWPPSHEARNDENKPHTPSEEEALPIVFDEEKIIRGAKP